MELSIGIAKSVHTGQLSLNALRRETYENTDRIDYVAIPISYEEFFHTYLIPNRSCILGKWATENWRSLEEWVDSSGLPALDWLKSNFGGAMCPVANCGEEKFSSHTKSTMTLGEFIDYLKSYSVREKDSDQPCLYLKDWHFTRSFPEYHAYKTPVFFQSDWLNEFCDVRDGEKDDYRFVYFGPKGSWTPFHADVLRSYSWSANICGEKRWILFKPGDEDALKSCLGTLPLDVTSPELDDETRYPHASTRSRHLEAIQRSGEVIFVASGWHHQVFNTEDTISINHNWLNGCNLDLCWRHLQSSLSAVQREISDCTDMDGWHEQCQLILKAVTGSDFYDFFSMLRTVGQRRLQALAATTDTTTRADHLNHGHALFDLVQISHVLREMLNTPEFLTLLPSRLPSEMAVDFENEIKAALAMNLD